MTGDAATTCEKKTRTVVRWLLAIATLTLILIFGFFVVRHRLQNEYCNEKSRNVYYKGSAMHAVIDETVCSGFGGSDVVTVSLAKNDKWMFEENEIVFKYDPSEYSGPLRIKWLRPDALEVSIDRVQFIEHQTSGAFGVSIVYRIGAVGNPENFE